MNFFMQYAGLLKASGRDSVDFFNRMTSNDVNKLIGSGCVTTVLLSDKGRIIDLLSLLKRDDFIYVKTSFNHESKVLEYLNKYIVMDDVELKKCDGQFVNFIVTGEGKENAISKVRDYESKLLQGNSEKDFLCYYTDDSCLNSLNIVCHLDKSHEIRSLLSNGIFQTCVDYELMRISLGQPEAPGELNEEINPLECGLKKYVSFTKGCYVGQEVIARLDSQSKIPKQLVRITSDEILKAGEKISDIKGTDCGFVSSCISNDGKNIALGFVRSTNLDFESQYFTEREGKPKSINIYKINQTS